MRERNRLRTAATGEPGLRAVRRRLPGAADARPGACRSARRPPFARTAALEPARTATVHRRGGEPDDQPPSKRQPETEGAQPGLLDSGRRLRRHVRHDVQEAEHREVPGGEEADRAALPRPPPAQPAPGRPGEVHRLRAVRLGLPGRRDLRRGRGQHRGGAVLPGRALRPRLPDQLPALHPVRPVHRGLPDPRADHDQRVRAGRHQPRVADLHQGPAARRCCRGMVPAAARDAAGHHREGLLPGPGHPGLGRAARRVRAASTRPASRRVPPRWRLSPRPPKPNRRPSDERGAARGPGARGSRAGRSGELDRRRRDLPVLARRRSSRCSARSG